MCGIFGFVVGAGSATRNEFVTRVATTLFELSEGRGREAAGIAFAIGSEIVYFKKATRAKEMLKSEDFQQFITNTLAKRENHEAIAFIGHSRLVTNGTQGLTENNQPVATDQCVGIHNGIIVNDADLWQENPDIKRKFEVDTEVFYRLIDKHFSSTQSLPLAMQATYKEIEGEANIAFFHKSTNVLGLASNVGSLYSAYNSNAKHFFFASERYFVESTLDSREFNGQKNEFRIDHYTPGKAANIDLESCQLSSWELTSPPITQLPNLIEKAVILDATPGAGKLVRCTRCILPSTFPFISFDRGGVCNFCREYVHKQTDNRKELEAKLAQFRSKDGSPDCIVALSGGRDSCYGLHYIKNELGLNPVAYTYDWAMVTDEARRNCARMCGALGVEHIIRSADIITKRRNIRLNIEAWLKRPRLGIIPLFMAGDKQFFHYATQVSKQTKIPLVIFCGGNNLEVTKFKTGFCGVGDNSTDKMLGLNLIGKLKLALYYAKNFILNPSYLNRSLFDTIFAFYSTYINRQDFLYLYKYIEWDEAKINSVLRDQYAWESSGDSASTWRIGDGTASFYNYIYHTVAGFSEHDTFRSNQIRAGLITREEALKLTKEENKPRYASMKEYAQLVGFNLDSALSVINNIPRMK